MSTPDQTEDLDPDIMSDSTHRASERSLSRARSVFARRSSALSPEEKEDVQSGIRYVHLNNYVSNGAQNFISNRLRSAKYTPLNLLPKALFEQFRRVSNFYFLVIAAISFIPGISPTTSIAQVLPLFVIVGFGLARDIYEDLQRTFEDNRQNSEVQVVMARSPSNDNTISLNLKPLSTDLTDTLREHQLDPELHHAIASRNIAVGDLVLVRKGQVFPCDIVLLYSSGEGGVAYVSTANLDGESNLKRVVVASPAADVTSPMHLRSLTGRIRAQKPTTALHEFEASMTLSAQTAAPLDASNLLLRGSILRNTDYIYGVAVYTGFDTKVALNMRHPPSKMGSIERKLNWVVVFLFVVLALLVISVAIASGILQGREGMLQTYMGENSLTTGMEAGTRGLGTFLILFSTFIPVSLFVTLEFIRVLQSLFMTADYRMKTRGQAVIARATNLNEMLGEVEHILSDKTGTLTENIMRYIACSADGKIYNILQKPNAMHNAVTNQVRPVCDLILSMALCHSVVPEPKSETEEQEEPEKKKKKKRKDRDSNRSNLTVTTNDSVQVLHEGALEPVQSEGHVSTPEELPEYQGQSPDEVALVSSAREFGITLLRRTLDTIVIDHFGTEESYTALAELEFNSDRKRMSMVLRCPDGKLRMITKGADTIMLTLLKAGSDLDTIQLHIDEFAKEGLRTLVFTMKELEEDYFKEWFERFQEARSSLEGREDKVAAVSAEIETDLDFVATTAVEDKLQDKVPETIKFMREAGVKLWVLTGDKRETAENIGYSANLLNREMEVVHIKGTTSEEIRKQLSDTLDRHIADDDEDLRVSQSLGRTSSLINMTRRMSMSRRKVDEKEVGIIIDGGSLHFAIEDHSQLLMALSDHLKVVICCRVTPLQKALVVRLVREERQSTTLAIGDGGNDVSMIQEAHIGVGIFGKEGTQAARSADYAIGEFKHLLRLTALHGRFCGVRTAGMINLSFYKNIFFTLTQVFFQVFAFASGQTFNNQWITSAFNVVVTSASPFLYGIFERDIDESTAVRFPSVYASNRDRKMFSLKSVIEYTLLYGAWHAVVVFFGVYLTFGYLKIDYPDGKDSGLFLVGFANSTIAVLMVLFKILLHSHTLNWIVLLSMLLSVALYAIVPSAAIYVVSDHALEGQLSMLFTSPTFYLCAFVIMTASFLLDFVVLIGRQMFAPNVVDRLQRWEREYRKKSKSS